MPNQSEYLEYILEVLEPLGEITARSMMGGHVLYCNGVVFALLASNTLYLKADDITRPNFEKIRSKPFQPFPDQPGTMQYYPPPAEFFEDPDVMREWGSAAVEAGGRSAAKRKGKAKATKKSARPKKAAKR